MALRGLGASLLARPQAMRAADDGFRILEARPGQLRLLPEPAAPAAILGFDGQSPGPLLRLKQGEEVKLRLVNTLDQPLCLHWQGLRLPNAMDGAPGLTQTPVPPGGSFDTRFTPPDAGTFLYRAADPAQQARGLAGVLIVDEPEPAKTGVDMLAVIQEWRGDPGNPVVTLNGRALPASAPLAAMERVRLRLVNACATRICVISFEGFKPFIVAIDGQPCDPFQPVRDTVPAGPGARFDILFDSIAGGRVILRGENVPDVDLIRFGAARNARPGFAPIASPPRNPALPPAIKLQDSKKLDLALSGAGRALALTAPPGGKPLFSVPRGSPVTLGLVNKTALPAAFHVHGHVMRLLHDLDDGWEPYWRDAVLVNAGKTHHVAFVADNPGKWLVEALVDDADAPGLSAWFEVT